jgi:hypothetical protein
VKRTLLVFSGVAFLAAGLVIGLYFGLGLVLPPRAAMVVLAVVAALGLFGIRLTPLSAVTRFAVLLYSLPFVGCLGYLVDPDFVISGSPAREYYASDPLVVSEMLAVATAGLLGLCGGMLLAARHGALGARSFDSASMSDRSARSLPMGAFLGLLAVAFGIAWFSAPPETILTASYALEQTTALLYQANFAGAHSVSYVLFVLLILDAGSDVRPTSRSIKLILSLGALLFVIVVLQYLRGHRNSFGLVLALCALYVSDPSPLRPSLRAARYAFVSLVGIAVVVISIVVGGIRSGASSGDFAFAADELFENVFVRGGNPWTMALMTNLSMAAQNQMGYMQPEWGKTYLDYVLSLPPGIITAALGITRPLEAQQGPAWWFASDVGFTAVAAGGIHVALVPYRNLGITGTVLVLALFGYLLARIERGDQRVLRSRAAYAAAIVFLPEWFWYGDMYAIRAAMAFALLWLVYRWLCRPMSDADRTRWLVRPAVGSVTTRVLHERPLA